MSTELISHLRTIENLCRQVRLKNASPQKLVLKNRTDQGPIHIVYVLTHVSICGGVKVIFEHANGLHQMGAKVTLISHFPKPDWYPIHVDYITIPFQIELTRGIPQCDIIVATYWDHIHACIETGIAPVVYFEQGDFHLFEWDQLSSDLQTVIKRQFELPIKIITVSHKVAAIIKERFNRNPEVFPNALDKAVFYPKENPAKSQDILIVGSETTAFKGIADLKQVYESIQAQGHDCMLHWITATEPVHPLGKVYVNPSPEQIGDLYRHASVYVCGSYYESFPLPPLEAMACGTPVVTTRNVGVTEYAIDGYNCLMTEPGNISGLAERVNQLLENKELYSNLQAGGIETAKKYQWTTILQELLTYYQQLSKYSPLPQNSSDVWERFYHQDSFVDSNDLELIEKFLSQTFAAEVLCPVQYPLGIDQTFVIWRIVAKRKSPSNNSFSEKLPFKVKETGIPDYPFKEVLNLYLEQKYIEALQWLNQKLIAVPSGSKEKAQCIRWIGLCLIKLELFNQAEDILEEAVNTYPLYTDLLYLLAKIHDRKGNIEKANTYTQLSLFLKDAFFYPEWFDNIDQLF